MLIDDLLAGVAHRWVRGEEAVSVAGVTNDSRKAVPGAVFVAVRGLKTDGTAYAAKAVEAGAEIVVVGAGRSSAPELQDVGRLIEVDDERAALAVMARNLHRRVDEKLPVVGVTGTNGKTTTCQILAAILEEAGIKAGLLGTVRYELGDRSIEAGRTTPEAPEIHEYLSRMAAAGCGACVMEVSSHALDLKRVHGMEFRVAVFTNLTRDHLDYHEDMERYFRAKSGLFGQLGAGGAAVVNLDDPYGLRLAGEIESGKAQVLGFGRSPRADFRMVDVRTGASGGRFALEAEEGRRELECSLPGLPNAYNAAAAAVSARAMGVGWREITRAIPGVVSVPGRMERVGTELEGLGFTVLVDYAHTDDALRNLLEALRPMTRGKVIVVFGCGGDRDRSKRPLMGAHAARLADVAIVTSDNPRSERPEAIIEEILQGMGQEPDRETRVRVEPDRKKAIGLAMALAGPGDTIAIAGKGHETYQIIGDRIVPFDDRIVAREALEHLLGREGAGEADHS